VDEATDQEILNVKEIVGKFWKIRNNQSLWIEREKTIKKDKKTRKRTEAKQKILFQESKLQVDKVMFKKSLDLNQWSNIKVKFKPRYCEDMCSNEFSSAFCYK
jgi:hypothetical protein